MKSRFHVKSGVTDLWDYLREPRPFRWTLLLVSVMIPVAGVLALTQESYLRPPDPPKVVFISTFAEGRTDAEIRQSNLENQRRKDEREAELEALRKQKVEAYKTLGRATGLDVDEMARKAAIENAREAAAEEARRKELYQAGQTVADDAE
ncbi:hypothetical protein K3172_04615 [Qipengyuania sp. 6B39]|uniref:hypothetical protein n=1 Tax=Qipengyuania proteolytica TaxID=2867239 RepID=UPI001C89FCF9|nr:hypothetical protein [Qipengyuania proteolytica]MBX7495138.1 hypothetical protein [Qipengyuania proteolytica]